MIPKKTLQDTIDKFFKEFDQINSDLDKYKDTDFNPVNVPEEDKDKFLKYFNMTKAWAELDNSVERLTQFFD